MNKTEHKRNEQDSTAKLHQRENIQRAPVVGSDQLLCNSPMKRNNGEYVLNKHVELKTSELMLSQQFFMPQVEGAYLNFNSSGIFGVYRRR